MASRDLLRSNVGPESPLVFTKDFTKSPFKPAGWEKTTNNGIWRTEVPCIGQISDASGTTADYDLPKNADYYGWPEVQIPFSAITPAADASTTCFHDYVGLHAIQEVRMTHVANTLAKLYGPVLKPKYLLDYDRRRRKLTDAQVLGNYSLQERCVMAKYPQVARVPLDNWLWFTYSTSDFIPVIFFSQLIRFSITFNSMQNLIFSNHTTGAPSATISTQVIKGISYPLAIVFTCAHISGDERVERAKPFSGKGILKPYRKYNVQPRHTIPANTRGTYSIPLSSLRGQCACLWFVLVRQSDVTGNYTQRPNKFLSYVSVSFSGNNGLMIPVHTKETIDQRIREQFFVSESFPAQNIGVLPVGWSPSDPVNWSGGMHLGVISDPRLNIDFGNDAGDCEAYDVLNGANEYETAENVYVMVVSEDASWVHCIGGDAVSLF